MVFEPVFAPVFAVDATRQVSAGGAAAQPSPARADGRVAQAANLNSATQTSRPAVQTNVRSVPKFIR